jgi:hypothetical protein
MSLLTNEQFTEIIEKINGLELTEASDDLVLEYSQIKRQLIKWNENGQKGDIPGRSLLTRWGVFLPAYVPIPVDGEVVVKSGAQAPTVTKVENLTPKEEYDLQKAKDLIKLASYPPAIEIVKDLLIAAPEKRLLLAELKEMETEFSTKTNQKVRDARTQVNRNLGNLSRQREIWKAVLIFNPECVEVKSAIAEIDQKNRDANDKKVAQQFHADATTAFKQKDLPLLNKALTDLDILIKTDGLSEANKNLATSYYTEARANRDVVRGELGQSSTKMVEGELRESYILAQSYFKAKPPIPVVIDAAGLMGQGANAEIPTTVFYNHIRNDFLTDLGDLISQRITNAEDLMKSIKEDGNSANNPKRTLDAADNKLEEGLALLSDDLLTYDDKLRLNEFKNQIEDDKKTIGVEFQKYNKAQLLIDRKNDEGLSLSERLKNLKDAQNIYPKHQDLKDAFIEVREKIEAASNRNAETAIRNADFAMGQEIFDDAVSILEGGRKTAEVELADIEFSGTLATIFSNFGVALQKTKNSQAEYQSMFASVTKALDSLALYDSSRKQADLDTAVSFLDEVAQKYSAHIKVANAWKELSKRQADPIKWKKGNDAYSKYQWAEAENNFSQIKPDFEHFEEAQILARRAEAALKYNEGLAAKEQQKWISSKKLFENCLITFLGDGETNRPSIGTDMHIQHIIDLCKRELESIKPLAEGEERITKLISKCQNDLDAIRQANAGRTQGIDKVVLIPQFSTIIKELNDAARATLVRSGEMTILISDVRQEWQKTYAAGMQAAIDSKELSLITKAQEQAKELDGNGLLTDTNKMLSYQLDETKIDLEYQILSPEANPDMNTTIDWKRVEENRSKKFDIVTLIQFLFQKGSAEWLEYQQNKTELKITIGTITKKRVKKEIEQIVEQGTARLPTNAARRSINDVYRSASQYFGDQMEKLPILRDDLTLIQLWMHLAWQAFDWPNAETIAKKITSYGTFSDGFQFEDFYKSLNSLAKAYSENNISKGDAILLQLENKNTEWMLTHKILLQSEQAFLRGELKNRLMKEAENELDRKSPQGYLVAAQKFALLYQLDPSDEIVRQGLHDCGGSIESGLNSILATAENFSIGNVKLIDAIGKAEELLGDLDAISNVSGHLNLDGRMSRRLETAITSLIGKKDKWLSINTSIDQFQQELEKCMNTPRQFAQDGTGGWNIISASNKLEDIRRGIGNDNELVNYANSKVREVEEVDKVSGELNLYVNNLMSAVFNEQFELVIDHARKLDVYWQSQSRRDARWGGLEVMLREQYSKPLREATSPKHHMDNAQRQIDNFQAWKNWADTIVYLFDEVERVSIDPQSSLSNICLEYSLDIVIEECELIIRSVDKFNTVLRQKPTDMPFSQKTRNESERVKASYQSKLSQTNLLAKKLKTEAIDEKARFEGLAVRLRGVMKVVGDLEKRNNGRVPQGQLIMAENAFKDCERIDPKNKELFDYRNTLRRLK